MEWMVGAGSASLMVGIVNTVVDCVMTFFGSTSNDACFNAHVTDVTNEHNRPKVESILSVMLVAGGVLILMSQSLFRAINPTSSPAPEKIDASPIVSSVFAFLGAALGLFGAYKAIKD